MAVHASWNLVRLLLPETPFDGLDVDLLNSSMAGCTGGRHVFVMDTGTGIRVGEDVV
jgi:hypothetical protein